MSPYGVRTAGLREDLKTRTVVVTTIKNRKLPGSFMLLLLLLLLLIGLWPFYKGLCIVALSVVRRL